jgi:potassium efflux system protein
MNRSMPTHLFACLAVTLSALAFLLGVAKAEEPAQARPLNVLVKEWTAVLDQAEKALLKPDVSDEKLDELRTELTGSRLEAISRADAARPEAQQIREELDTLGTPPTEGAPAESPAVAAKRKAISERLTAIEGAIKESELIVARSDRILSQITTLRRTRFTERLLARGASPLSPNVWQKALPEIAADFGTAGQNIRAWVSSESFAKRAPQMAWRLFLGLLAAFVLVWGLRLWLVRKFGYVTVQTEPTHGQRLRTALFTGFIRILLPSAVAIAVYLTLDGSGLLSEQARNLAWTALVALIFLFFVAAFCRAALAPFQPSWRIVHLNDYGARAVGAIVTGIAFVFALDRVLDELRTQFESSLELTIVHKFVSGLAITGLLLVLLRHRIWRTNEEADADAAPGRPWKRLRIFLRMLTLAIPLSALFGYVALSRVLATQFVLTAGLYVTVIVLRQVSAETIAHTLSQNSTVGMRLRNSLSLTEEGSEMLRFWLTEAVGAGIVLLGIVALLVLWGAGKEDLAGWLYTVFFGFKVGNITISLSDLLLAALLFAVLLTATRLLQRALERQIFPRTRLDLGVRHSIRSAVGYIGFTVAAVVAISTVGIDLSNLAIIAGALSVGIGFGLQNIVNNFVSGLILLVERPIKVGDRVAVGDHQGYVRKISVRATEISTNDQASVFIPNSSLIANAVVNRTYADKSGKVLIPLSVSYGTDAKKVREVLLEIAKSHPDVRRSPGSSVFFRGFGNGALNFELTAVVSDAERVTAVCSDLCFAIDDVFRREGIRMPYPQRDVHLGLQHDQLDRLIEAMGSKKGGTATISSGSPR